MPKDCESVQCLVSYGHEKIPDSVLEFVHTDGLFKRGGDLELTAKTHPMITHWQPLAKAGIDND